MMWRAGFPLSEDILRAQAALAERTGKEIAEIQQLTGQVTKRGDLREITPEELAERWAETSGVSQSEVLRFLYEAGFLLS